MAIHSAERQGAPELAEITAVPSDAIDVVDGARSQQPIAVMVIVATNHTWGAVHMQIITIGLDIAKNVFQVHGIDAEEKVVVRRQLCESRNLFPARTRSGAPAAREVLGTARRHEHGDRLWRRCSRNWHHEAHVVAELERVLKFERWHSAAGNLMRSPTKLLLEEAEDARGFAFSQAIGEVYRGRQYVVPTLFVMTEAASAPLPRSPSFDGYPRGRQRLTLTRDLSAAVSNMPFCERKMAFDHYKSYAAYQEANPIVFDALTHSVQ